MCLTAVHACVFPTGDMKLAAVRLQNKQTKDCSFALNNSGAFVSNNPKGEKKKTQTAETNIPWSVPVEESKPWFLFLY